MKGTIAVIDGRSSNTLERAQGTDTLETITIGGEIYTTSRTDAEAVMVGGVTSSWPFNRATVVVVDTSVLSDSRTAQS